MSSSVCLRRGCLGATHDRVAIVAGIEFERCPLRLASPTFDQPGGQQAGRRATGATGKHWWESRKNDSCPANFDHPDRRQRRPRFQDSRARPRPRERSAWRRCRRRRSSVNRARSVPSSSPLRNHSRSNRADSRFDQGSSGQPTLQKSVAFPMGSPDGCCSPAEPAIRRGTGIKPAGASHHPPSVTILSADFDS